MRRTMQACIQLPLDSDVRYYPDFLTAQESGELYAYLDAVESLKDLSTVMADGSRYAVQTGRHFFLDPDLAAFDVLPEVWGPREPWPDFVVPIRDRVAEASGAAFHVCRIVYYPDGGAGVDWHRDIPAYGDTSVIGSVSVGAVREFGLRRRGRADDVVTLPLAHGSLVVMGRGTQDLYEHALLEAPACREPRFNLTFRAFTRR